MSASTLTPKEVAVLMVESGVMKHKTRYDVVLFKAVRMLSRQRLSFDTCGIYC